MAYETLISVAELMALQRTSSPLVLLDCGFDLSDTNAGEHEYEAFHLPGAAYAHLDRDLAGAKTGRNGRHPLPERAAFAARVGAWGIAPGIQVVAYDAQAACYASRAWWMLRWLGHTPVAVLDGGIGAWRRAGGELVSTVPVARAQAPYPDRGAAMPTLDVATLQTRLGQLRLLDARAAERFRGEVEPLDPVAGHIPGSSLRHFKDNLQPSGLFKPAAQLRAEFDALQSRPEETVHLCGSGVTACHNLLAMAHANLPGSALYAGSWSEWCADPSRPVARG